VVNPLCKYPAVLCPKSLPSQEAKQASSHLRVEIEGFHLGNKMGAIKNHAEGRM